MDERVVERTRLLLGPDAPDDLVEFAAALAKEQVLGYCNLSQVPGALVHTAAALAAELYRTGAYGVEQPAPQARAVTRMDVSYTFLTPYEQMQQAAGEGGLLAGYAARLAPYRKMRW